MQFSGQAVECSGAAGRRARYSGSNQALSPSATAPAEGAQSALPAVQVRQRRPPAVRAHDGARQRTRQRVGRAGERHCVVARSGRTGHASADIIAGGSISAQSAYVAVCSSVEGGCRTVAPRAGTHQHRYPQHTQREAVMFVIRAPCRVGRRAKPEPATFEGAVTACVSGDALAVWDIGVMQQVLMNRHVAALRGSRRRRRESALMQRRPPSVRGGMLGNCGALCMFASTAKWRQRCSRAVGAQSAGAP